MAEYSGTACLLTWQLTAGTTLYTLSGDYRTLSIEPTVDLIETTAGGDTLKGRIPHVTDCKISASLVTQAGGTALFAGLAPGGVGTVTVAPEGTATGKPKTILTAICMGAQQNVPYNDVVEISCEFQGNGSVYTQTAY